MKVIIYNARSNKFTFQPRQILHLPRKMTGMLNPGHIWNVIYNARSNRCHDPTSPNIAPVTKKWRCKISEKMPQNRCNVIQNAGTIRAWSDHDPSMKPSVRNPPRNRGYFSRLLWSTLLYSTSTLLYSTLLYFTLLYPTLLYFTLLYPTLLYFTLLYSAILFVYRKFLS